MGTDTQINVEKTKLFAYGLQTLGGILIAISGYFLNAAHKSIEKLEDRVQQCEGRHIRTETRLDGQDAMLKEIRDDVKRLVNRP